MSFYSGLEKTAVSTARYKKVVKGAIKKSGLETVARKLENHFVDHIRRHSALKAKSTHSPDLQKQVQLIKNKIRAESRNHAHGLKIDSALENVKMRILDRKK